MSDDILSTDIWYTIFIHYPNNVFEAAHLLEYFCASSSFEKPITEHFSFHNPPERFSILAAPMYHSFSCPVSTITLVNLSLIFQESQLSLIFFINTLFSMAKVFRFLRHNAIYESVKFDVQILSYSVYTVY